MPIEQSGLLDSWQITIGRHIRRKGRDYGRTVTVKMDGVFVVYKNCFFDEFNIESPAQVLDPKDTGIYYMQVGGPGPLSFLTFKFICKQNEFAQRRKEIRRATYRHNR